MSASSLYDVAFAGTIICSLSRTPPKGYLKLDGSLLNKSDYPELYSRLTSYLNDGGIFESGTSIYFKLPDFRGRFLRARDPYSTFVSGIKDPGILRSDSVKYHQHVMAWGEFNGAGAIYGVSTFPKGHWGSSSGDRANFLHLTNNGASNINGQDWVGEENRPVNIAVNYFIKY